MKFTGNALYICINTLSSYFCTQQTCWITPSNESYCTKWDGRGRAIAQAVSRRLPIAAARVRSQVKSCGICGGQRGLVQGFSEYFGFPCQFSFHRLLHTHHIPSGAGTVVQLVADVPSDSVSPKPKRWRDDNEWWVGRGSEGDSRDLREGTELFMHIQNVKISFENPLSIADILPRILKG
jgi:hypothetical protein